MIGIIVYREKLVLYAFHSTYSYLRVREELHFIIIIVCVTEFYNGLIGL